MMIALMRLFLAAGLATSVLTTSLAAHPSETCVEILQNMQRPGNLAQERSGRLVAALRDKLSGTEAAAFDPERIALVQPTEQYVSADSINCIIQPNARLQYISEDSPAVLAEVTFGIIHLGNFDASQDGLDQGVLLDEVLMGLTSDREGFFLGQVIHNIAEAGSTENAGTGIRTPDVGASYMRWTIVDGDSANLGWVAICVDTCSAQFEKIEQSAAPEPDLTDSAGEPSTRPTEPESDPIVVEGPSLRDFLTSSLSELEYVVIELADGDGTQRLDLPPPERSVCVFSQEANVLSFFEARWEESCLDYPDEQGFDIVQTNVNYDAASDKVHVTIYVEPSFNQILTGLEVSIPADSQIDPFNCLLTAQFIKSGVGEGEDLFVEGSLNTGAKLTAQPSLIQRLGSDPQWANYAVQFSSDDERSDCRLNEGEVTLQLSEHETDDRFRINDTGLVQISGLQLVSVKPTAVIVLNTYLGVTEVTGESTRDQYPWRNRKEQEDYIAAYLRVAGETFHAKGFNQIQVFAPNLDGEIVEIDQLSLSEARNWEDWSNLIVNRLPESNFNYSDARIRTLVSEIQGSGTFFGPGSVISSFGRSGLPDQRDVCVVDGLDAVASDLKLMTVEFASSANGLLDRFSDRRADFTIPTVTCTDSPTHWLIVPDTSRRASTYLEAVETFISIFDAQFFNEQDQ